MGKAALASKRKSGTRRGRDGAIDKVDGFGEHARPVGIGEPTRHGVPSGLAPIARISPILTSVVDRPALRSRLDDAVGGVALRDAVQRDGRAVPGEGDPVLAHKQAVMANLRQRFGQLPRRRPFAVGPLRREMIRIKLP